MLILKRRIPSQNVRDRWHWRVKDKDKNVWLILLRAACGGQQTPPTTPRTVTIFSFRWRLIADHGNLVGGAKGLVDAIVAVGLLKDDADQWARIRYEQRLCPKGHDRTEIEVEGWEPRHQAHVQSRAEERRAKRLAAQRGRA